MLGDEEHIEFDLNDKEEGFRYYRIVVKTMTDEKIQHQNLEIYTSGLKSLLEMRRMHTLAFTRPVLEHMQELAQAN